jgi:hypothetical protein
MKLALATLNVGGKSLHQKSRASFLEACQRWGCEFIEFTDPLAPCHHFWQKTFAPLRLSQYDRVLQLDADMLIRWNAPSPFDLVPDTHIGVVSSRQFTPPDSDYATRPLSAGEKAGVWISKHRTRCIGRWAERMGMDPCHDEWHLNGGFFLYSPGRHAELFSQLRDVGEKAGWTRWRLPEQAALSVLLANTDTPATWLGHEWNTVAACQRIRPEHSTGYMQGWIYHFTGRQHRGKRISRTRWEASPCDEIAARLPADGSWAEIGVADGYNALGVLWQRPESRAVLVDQWAVASDQYRKSGDLAAKLTAGQWDLVKSRATELTAGYNREIVQSDSESAAAGVQDSSLDLVYIDAEHTYEAVRADVQAWLPKVKPGGWIGGHDYKHPMDARGVWGVSRAVDEIFGGLVALGACNTWWVRAQL